MRPDAPYHLGWPAWREGERIYVQERLFLREQLNGDFDPEYPEVHVGERREVSIEGARICQWTLGLRDVTAFVQRRTRREAEPTGRNRHQVPSADGEPGGSGRRRSAAT
jgi:hypothetical protein